MKATTNAGYPPTAHNCDIGPRGLRPLERVEEVPEAYDSVVAFKESEWLEAEEFEVRKARNEGRHSISAPSSDGGRFEPVAGVPLPAFQVDSSPEWDVLAISRKIVRM